MFAFGLPELTIDVALLLMLTISLAVVAGGVWIGMTLWSRQQNRTGKSTE